MSGIARFEDIEAWQRARQLTKQVFEITGRGNFARKFGLRDQMRRAAISIMSNIAEGFDRGGDREFLQFLAIAKGSASELKSQLYIALDAELIDQQTFDAVYDLTSHVTNLIGAFMRYLKSSPLKGNKYNTRNDDIGH